MTHRSGLLALSLLLAGCADPEPRADLVFIQSAEPETLDPALVSDQVSMRISEALFEGLCRVDAQGKAIPGMAERWDESADKRHYTFYLRQGTRWSNGQPVTAADFVSSWQRALEPATGADYASQLYVLKNARKYNEGSLKDFTGVGVRALNHQTLQVELEFPTPYFIDLCAFLTLAPVPARTVAAHGTAWIKPGKLVGNGAYTLADWKLDDRILLKKNPDYWDASNVQLNSVEVRPVTDPNAALNYFVSGEVDLMMDKGMVPAALVDELKKAPWFHSGPFLGTWFVRLNVTKPPFNDPRVRKAFALATDKRRIVERITKLGERTAGSLVPPGAGQGYQPPAGLEPDIAQARALLAEAGYPGGKGFPTVDYLYIPLVVERNIAVELKAMWESALQINVSLSKQEQKSWLSSMRDLSYQMCRSSWVGDYNDPMTFLEMFTTGNGNNRTGWASKTYDASIQAAAKEPDVAKRQVIMQAAESELVNEQCAILPVYFYVGVQFYDSAKLSGVEPNLIDQHPFRCMTRTPPPAAPVGGMPAER
jgi:oligopeptide transport system substrate-binding protein